MMESLIVTFYTMCWTVVLGLMAFLAFDAMRTLINQMRWK